MAADLNNSHILHEFCNANQVCFENEDNYNNISNAGIADETWPPTSMMTQSQEQECTYECRSERNFECQDKKDEMKEHQGNLYNSPVSSKNSNNKNQTDEASPKSNISSKGSVFEKWAAIERANQRPLAKRQLSDFSKAFTSRTVKKTLVKEKDQTDKKVQSSATALGRRDDQIVLKLCGSRRKLQKELITSTEDFYRVDTHAINAGQEVRNISHLI